MEKKTWKQYTADFKAKVVKEMLKEEKTVGQQEERIYDITIKEEALYKKKQLY